MSKKFPKNLAILLKKQFVYYLLYILYTIVHILFSRIVQLVLVRTREAFLNTGVGPKALHGCEQFVTERFSVFHASDNVHHQLRIRFPVWCPEWNVQRAHRSQNCDQALYCVRIDDRFVSLTKNFCCSNLELFKFKFIHSLFGLFYV